MKEELTMKNIDIFGDPEYLYPYKFDVEKVFKQIENATLGFTEKVGTKRVVLGISGGKDSSIIAWAMKKILGAKNVFGVMMPNGVQPDIADAEQVFAETGINKLEVNIGKAFEELFDEVKFEAEAAVASDESLNMTDTKINMPPRLRMTALFGVAQAVNGIVLNTDNLEEICLGYYTIFGDGAGSFGPIRDLTVPEVLQLGKWLGVPDNLVYKTPGDGLQAEGDEARMGISYAEMHEFLRKNGGSDEMKKKVIERYYKNKFKTDIVNIPCPKFEFPNFLTGENTEVLPF